MRYFLTPDASRSYIASGYTFTFEPVQNRGGSWLGVLAVEEDSAASALAAIPSGVDEIAKEHFDDIKKKLAQTMIGSSASPMPQQAATGHTLADARLAGGSGRTHGLGNPLIPRPVAPAPVVESVDIQVTMVEPPHEALLDQPSVKSGKKYSGGAR